MNDRIALQIASGLVLISALVLIEVIHLLRRPARAPLGPYVWIGEFRIRLQPSGERFYKGSLGVYPTADYFLAQWDAEIRSREELIHEQFSASGFVIEKIELLGIERISVRLAEKGPFCAMSLNQGGGTP